MAIIKECNYISVPLRRANGREVIEPKQINGEYKVFINESLVLLSLIFILRPLASLKIMRNWAFWGFTIISLIFLIVWGIELTMKLF